MNKTEILQALHKMHKPEARDHAMVWQVWEDGEVTLQKGGPLFGQRNLHTIAFGCAKGLPVQQMPVENRAGEHGYLFVDNESEANEARSLVRAYQGAPE